MSLADVCCKALYIEKNAEQAFRWYSLSAEQGYVSAVVLLNGLGCTQDGTEGSERSESGSAGRRRLPSILMQFCSHAGAVVRWTTLKRGGRRVPPRKKNRRIRKRCQTLLLEGKGGDEDAAQACWLVQARGGRRKRRLPRTGLPHRDAGKHAPKDSAEALRWFEKAAALDHAGALSVLGLMYETGQNVPADLTKGFPILRARKAIGVFRFLQMRLGSCYYLGRGTVKGHYVVLAHKRSA